MGDIIGFAVVGALGMLVQAVVGFAGSLFALLFLARVRVRLGEGMPAQFGVGFLSGLLGGSISESGPPVVIYALSREWAKDVFRTTLLAYFLVLAIVAAVSYAALDMLDRWTVTAAAVALVPTVCAAALGVRIKRRLEEKHFRYLVLGTIMLVSVLGLVRHAGLISF